MTETDMDGAKVSRRAASLWKSDWLGDDFMAVGEKNELIPRWLMKRIHEILRSKRPALMLPEVEHFVHRGSLRGSCPAP